MEVAAHGEAAFGESIEAAAGEVRESRSERRREGKESDSERASEKPAGEPDTERDHKCTQ